MENDSLGRNQLQNSGLPTEGRFIAYMVCWLLGIGSLFPWNSMSTIEDYYQYIFKDYHSSRVLTLVYQPFSLLTLAILTYHEANVNTRLRNLSGYLLFFISTLIVLLLDIATHGRGGLGTFIGICSMSAVFGIADAHVQGGMFGDLSFMHPDFIQSFSAGLAASGAVTSVLRFITKGAFDDSKNGLRNGALLFFALSALYELFCTFLYAFAFPRLKIVNHYRAKAASEGAKTVSSDLAAGGITVPKDEKYMEVAKRPKRLHNKELLKQNIDYGIDIFLVYVLTLSIFPGFLSEDTGKHSLGSWYAILLIAMFNFGDVIGRYIPLIKAIKLERRPWLMVAALARLAFIPAFYFIAKYGSQGWMLMLCVFLGVSNGYLTVCIFTLAPKGYKGPEQNALGNILVLFCLTGIFAGVTLDWLWLIGKGW